MVRLVALLGGLVGVIVVAVGVWYFVFRDDAPPPVDLESAVEAAASATAPAQGTAAGTANAGDARAAATAGDLAGSWQVAPGSQSFVGYRVREELANFGAATAVGRTADVTGTLEFDGAQITAVDIEADLTTLASDQSRRDNALRQQALETNEYPTATFTLTEPIQLEGAPEAGETISATAMGDLTLHGVTKQVGIPVEGQLTNGQVVVVGSLDIVFADFAIDQPSAASVLSVEDHGVLEIQLVFGRE